MSYAEAKETMLVNGISLHMPAVVRVHEKSEVKKKTHVNDEPGKPWIILNLFWNINEETRHMGRAGYYHLEDKVSFIGGVLIDFCGLMALRNERKKSQASG